MKAMTIALAVVGLVAGIPASAQDQEMQPNASYEPEALGVSVTSGTSEEATQDAYSTSGEDTATDETAGTDSFDPVPVPYLNFNYEECLG
jgi:hypothetical protein